MATWKRISSEPVTTEKQVRVVCTEDGREGYASVSWNGPGHHPHLFGAITEVVERFYNSDGSEYQDPKIEVLDRNPTFA